MTCGSSGCRNKTLRMRFREQRLLLAKGFIRMFFLNTFSLIAILASRSQSKNIHRSIWERCLELPTYSWKKKNYNFLTQMCIQIMLLRCIRELQQGKSSQDE